jgi:hypothetical protein
MQIIDKLKIVSVTVITILMAPAIVGAATLLSQSYTTDEKLPTGAIVSLEKGSTKKINPATTENANYLLGVVVQGDSSQISISSMNTNQVYVANSGIEPVIVSDINGEISVGDPITASPIKGVGMKATGNVKIVGVAQDSFPNNSAKQQTYKDSQGKEQSIKLGDVSVLVNVAYYYKQPDKTLVPLAIQNIADALAGKKVDSLPILISIGIFITTMVIVAVIIYSMIRSSIISVGRNPMSQAAIYRNVMQLSALVIAILGVAVGSIYMVLTKF